MSEAGPPPGSDDPTQGGGQPPDPPTPTGEPAGWDPPPGTGPPPGYGFPGGAGGPPGGPGQPPGAAGPPPGGQYGGIPPGGQYGQPPPQYGGQPPYGQPPPGQYGGWQQPYGWTPPFIQETNSKATAALILGIAGLILCPLICSVIALVLGYQARREIDESQGRQTGRGNAVAGIVLGWIGVAFSVLGIIFIVVVAIVADDTTSNNYDSFDLGPRWRLAVAAARAVVTTL
jgi:uncharacterized protein DUF4190